MNETTELSVAAVTNNLDSSLQNGTATTEVATFGKARLINRLTIQDLQAVQEAFFLRKEREETELTLDQEQFCELLSIVLSKGSREEFSELFEKVDVNKEGLIDWDKLCSHLLLQYYEKDDRIKSTQVPQWQELKSITCPHKDVINRFQGVGSPIKYYTSVSREGNVAFWNLDLRQTRSFHVQTNPEEIKPRDLWVTHFTPMGHINKLALSLTSKEIAVYDLSSKTEFNCQYRIFGLKSTPITLDYWSNPNKSSHSILSFGDTGGNVHAIVFTNATIALFERPLQPAGSKQETCLQIDINDVAKCLYQHARYYTHDCHQEWVRKTQYLPSLDCFISCSTTNTNSMTLGWTEKGKIDMRTTCFSVLQGLNSFDFNAKANLIATAGINTQVCLWNPYVISKPVGVLQGHMQSVISVTFVENKNQLISLSKEKVLRIWDTHLQVCLQRLSGIFPKINDAAVTMYFDQERSKLFCSFNNQLTVLSMKAEIKDRVISHEHAVTDAIYSKNFNQVVSVCAGSVITMWMLDSGQKVKQFTNAHGTAEITCLSQDPSGMRILTGSTDGTIKIWDFNGQCHHILMAGNGNPCEIGQIMYLKSSIISIGWDKAITCFPIGHLKTFYVYPVDWKGRLEHQDDILSTTFIPPRTLASGGFDGDIVLWNVITEHAYRHLGAKKAPAVKDRRSSGHMKLLTPTSSAGKLSAKKRYLQSSPFLLPSPTGHLEESQANTRSYAMTCLLSLCTRANPITSSGPSNLISATCAGLVIFWNVYSSQVAAEFVAHEQTSSMTMATDNRNKFLVTGDSDGVCRVWLIEDYCMACSDTPLKSPPKLCETFTPHTDAINSITVINRSDIYLIITASSDCCLSLSTINGTRIGVFGQEHHWNIDKVLNTEREFSVNKNESSKLIPDAEHGVLETDIDMEENGRVQHVLHNDLEAAGKEQSDIKVDVETRHQTWDNTILGRSYQERGSEKRERKQPYSLPFLNVERGQMSISAFQALNCKDLSDVPTLLKPDFVLHPERYFTGDNEKSKSEEIPCLPPIVDTLQQRHDEKTLFPKSLLDDMKMKAASLAFSSNSRYGKGSHPSIHQTVSNPLSVGSVVRSNRPVLEAKKNSKDKKSNVWNRKILGKIASGMGTADAGNKADTFFKK